jgi:hypothetical protein
MAGRWSLHLFDWERFGQLAPHLREAAESDDFSHLEDEEADDLLEQLDDSAAPEEVCNALLLHLCVSAESAVFDRGLPELILWIRRREGCDDCEDAADMLGALLSRANRVEPWFACDAGLMGMLSREEAAQLDRRLDAFRRNRRTAAKRAGFGALTRLFTTTDPARENVDDLIEIVGEAAARKTGLAAVLEE